MDAHVRLRRLLTRSGTTTAVFARHLGCSRPFVSLLLSGRKTPGLALAVRIQRVTCGAIRAEDWVPAEPVETLALAAAG